MRCFTIKSSDIACCPISSLSPEHYRDDGTCKCAEKEKREHATRGKETRDA